MSTRSVYRRRDERLIRRLARRIRRVLVRLADGAALVSSRRQQQDAGTQRHFGADGESHGAGLGS
ncbi:MAG: hypothetical protein ABW024_01185, partial [Microbacterium sp.]